MYLSFFKYLYAVFKYDMKMIRPSRVFDMARLEASSLLAPVRSDIDMSIIDKERGLFVSSKLPPDDPFLSSLFQ
jgi:hypothetical protein